MKTGSVRDAQQMKQCMYNRDRIQSPKYYVLNKKTGQWIMSKNTIIVKVLGLCEISPPPIHQFCF
jgi:hypothetical protein